MTVVITIIYVIVCLFMVLAILLQAGRGGGMGTALGGGASQSVFGGGGGADFMAKLTQGMAMAFVLCALYLAYEGAHSGSDFLKGKSQELAYEENLATAPGEVNYERVGPNPQPLPPARTAEASAAQDAAAQDAAAQDEAAQDEADDGAAQDEADDGAEQAVATPGDAAPLPGRSLAESGNAEPTRAGDDDSDGGRPAPAKGAIRPGPGDKTGSRRGGDAGRPPQ